MKRGCSGGGSGGGGSGASGAGGGSSGGGGAEGDGNGNVGDGGKSGRTGHRGTAVIRTERSKTTGKNVAAAMTAGPGRSKRGTGYEEEKTATENGEATATTAGREQREKGTKKKKATENKNATAITVGPGQKQKEEAVRENSAAARTAGLGRNKDRKRRRASGVKIVAAMTASPGRRGGDPASSITPGIHGARRRRVG